MSSYSIGKLDHHKRRYIKTFMHFGSPILGDGKAETSPILRVVISICGTHYPHGGGTGEFLNRNHFPHFGGDILYIAMYVGKIKRFLPLQNGLTTRPKSRSPLRAASAYEETEASQPEDLYETGIFSGVFFKMRPVLRFCGLFRAFCVLFPERCITFPGFLSAQYRRIS